MATDHRSYFQLESDERQSSYGLSRCNIYENEQHLRNERNKNDLNLNDNHFSIRNKLQINGIKLTSALVLFVFLIFFGVFGIVEFHRKNNWSSANENDYTLNSNSINSLDKEIPQALISPAIDDVVHVDTVCGKMIGIVEDGAFVFKGIRYASPPKGTQRWSRPIPIEKDVNHCRNDSRKYSTKFGSPCFQLNPLTKQYDGNEDCLFLNVWTPRLDESANLEVMVYIHGGFFQYGSGHQPGLRPSGKLSKKLNTVFVSFNYRLHAIGFLALDLLANSGANSSFGNYGLWDQFIALQWVNKNIQLFGGDPRKITLFGPDAGSASILALMSNSDAKELFNAAWLIGPALYFNQTFETASHRNHNHFLQNTNCTDVKCLRSLTAKEVIEAFLGKDDPSFRINDQNDLPIQGIFAEQFIVVDYELIEDSLPFEKKSINDIPLLIGNGEQAIEIWPGPSDLENWSIVQYEKYVTTSLDSFGAQLSQLALNLYSLRLNDTNENHSSIEMNPDFLYSTMVTDIRQTCPINFIFDSISRTFKSPSYRYVVKAHPSKPIRLYNYESKYSFHMWDLIAFFDQIDKFIRHPTDDDYNFTKQMQNIVLNFIKGKKTNLWPSLPENFAFIHNNFTTNEILANNHYCEAFKNESLLNYVWTC